MSDITWPSDLPAMFRNEGLSETLGDPAIESENDTGPANKRRRSTAAPDDLSGSLLLSREQTLSLDTFFKTTTKGGVLPFLWTHPRTLTTKRFRFASAPKHDPAGSLWVSQFSVKVLP